MAARELRYRNCCFTWNNPDGLIDFDEAKMDYLVYQEEVGAEGTYHFQGYCEFKEQLTQGQIKRLLGGDRVHVDRRRGSQEQAINYCKDVEKRIPCTEIYEEGTPKNQGKRIDLEAFKNAVGEGMCLRDLVEEHYATIARYPRFYTVLTQMRRPTRTVDLEVILLIGETGLGKTRSVYDAHGESNELFITPLSNGTLWWDGYDGHKIVLMDDFAGSACHMTLSTLLRLLDRYPVMAPIKGGFTWWLPDKIFVTTNLLPKLWYTWKDRMPQYLALARRFTKVVLFYHGGTVEQEFTWWQENSPELLLDIQN